jgi:hypothetical protein
VALESQVNERKKEEAESLKAFGKCNKIQYGQTFLYLAKTQRPKVFQFNVMINRPIIELYKLLFMRFNGIQFSS